MSIGLYPRYTCSTAHHVEQAVTVPYRYLKEFMHPVVRDGAVRVEPFYMYCLYRDSDVERNFLKWIFPRFAEDHELRRVKIGRGEAYSYSMREFFDAACSMFLANPYVWCERPPEVRPWRK